MTVERWVDELVEERSLDALERLTGSRSDEVLDALIGAAGRLLSEERADPADDEIVDAIRQHLVECRAVGSLIDALASPDETTQEFALRCLGEIGDVAAVEPMVRLLDEGSPRLREAAASHLALLTTYDFGADAARWREWLSRREKGLEEQAVEDREDQARRLRLQMRKAMEESADDEGSDEGGYRDDDDDRGRGRDDDDDY